MASSASATAFSFVRKGRLEALRMFGSCAAVDLGLVLTASGYRPPVSFLYDDRVDPTIDFHRS